MPRLRYGRGINVSKGARMNKQEAAKNFIQRQMRYNPKAKLDPSQMTIRPKTAYPKSLPSAVSTKDRGLGPRPKRK